MLSSTQCCTECSACAKNQERREQLVVSDAGTLLHGRLQGCSCGNVTLLLHCLVCVYVCGVVSWSHRYGDYFKISSTVVIAVIYIKVSREILAVFEPYLPKINDKLLLKADMSVEFLSSAHVVCMIVGFCMVVLFVLGVPVGTALLIHFQKDKILSGSKNFRRKYVPHPFMLLPLSLLWLVLCCGVVWCVVARVVLWLVLCCGSCCVVLCCVVVWCGVVWCGVVWCGVVWCGVVLHCDLTWLLLMYCCCCRYGFLFVPRCFCGVTIFSLFVFSHCCLSRCGVVRYVVRCVVRRVVVAAGLMDTTRNEAGDGGRRL